MENELAQAYGSSNPATNQMAAQGRKGDAMMAHVTPGDYVIPKDIIIQHPEFLTKLKKVMEDEHEDYRTHMVGSGFENINPETGAPEFGFGKAFKSFQSAAIGKPLNYLGSQLGDATRDIPIVGPAIGMVAGGAAKVGDAIGGKNTIGTGGYYGGLNTGETGKPGTYDAPKTTGMGTIAPYSPSNMTLPGSLQELGGLTDQQRRSYLATQGSQGEGLGGSGAEYYANLLQRNIQANPDQSLLPVESQYLNQHGIDTNLHGQALIEALRGF